MDSAIAVLQQLLDWRTKGQQAYLLTLLYTWGSAPRPVGSLLAMNDCGEYCGSLSGGCLEDNLLDRLQNLVTLPTCIHIDITQDLAQRFGLPCGGQQQILVETSPAEDTIKFMLDLLNKSQRFTKQTDLNSGQITINTGNPGQATIMVTEQRICHSFQTSYTLLLIGCCELSAKVAMLAKQLDFRVIICEPRELHYQFDQPENYQWTPQMPDDYIRQHVHEEMAVLALSHDPKLDDMALMEALISPAFYVGALGSRKNSQKRKQRLRTLGLPETAIGKLHAPIGLQIGSKTPMEIAIAIMAEVIQQIKGQSEK